MAKRFYITKNLDVLEFDAVNEWGYPRHKHNFFEITFILKGRGQHILNDSIINYNKGDIFFLTPRDEHEFVVSEPTTFGIIKFTEHIFLEKASFSSSNYWRKSIDAVVFHSNIIAESVVHCKNDQQQLIGLYTLIKSEIENALSYNRNVLTELFGALLIILSRNLKSTIKNKTVKRASNKEKIDGILTYVRQNVLDKEKVRIKVIADQFYLSPNYVSVFIKKHTGISLQQYVIETKIKMAERLLKQTHLSINEIAEKLKFTDPSHFNRIFKKKVGINPSDFKKSV